MIRAGTVVCLGEPLIRLAAPAGTTMRSATMLDLAVGGSELNVAVALSCLGRGTAMLTAVPDGQFGEIVLDHMRRFGVDARGVRRGSGRVGVYYLDRGGPGRAAAVTYDRLASLFATLGPDEFDWTAMDGAGHLHLSGITPALGDRSVGLAQRAIVEARRRSLSVSLDANVRPALWQGRPAAAILLGLAERVDIFFGGARDAELLVGEPVASGRAMEALFRRLPDLALVAGLDRQVPEHGRHRLEARVTSRDGGSARAAGETSGVVDRIGSGDAFVGGVLHALMEGWSLPDIASAGLTMATMKLGLDGDASTFDRDELAAGMRGAGDVRR